MKSAAILSTLLAITLAAPAPQHAHSKRQGQNFQTFTGALGGIAATPITDSGNPDRKFQVKGDTFVNIGAALQRSCDQQFNACANKANGGDKTLSVSACADQKTQCDAAGQGNTGASNNQAAGQGNTGASNNQAAGQGNTGASNNQAAAAPAVPCNQASNANAEPSAPAAAAGSSTTAAKNPSNTPAANDNSNAGKANQSKENASKNGKGNKGAEAAANPCNTAAASADSNAGKAKQNEGNASKNGKGNNGAEAAANPCNKKRGTGNKRSIAARRITRRYKVA